MPKGRWLRKEFWSWHSSFSVREEADNAVKYLRKLGHRAVVRAGGTKWDVFFK